MAEKESKDKTSAPRSSEIKFQIASSTAPVSEAGTIPHTQPSGRFSKALERSIISFNWALHGLARGIGQHENGQTRRWGPDRGLGRWAR